MLAEPMAPRLTAPRGSLPVRAAGAAALAILALAASMATAQEPVGDDPLGIPGQQNLTLGSGARAFGMGGAFLARADDATAAAWNPAGLSYLRAPELSFVGVHNSFTTTRSLDSDSLEGNSVDFAAFTYPIGAGEVRGAVQLSYQRALSFDGTRTVRGYGALRDDEDTQIGTQLIRTDEGTSDGGFDVVALGTGLRLSRHVRAGFTVNRWLNGYRQLLERNIYNLPATERRPRREFDLDFQPSGWSFNFGLIVSPVENLNLAAVYKTPFTADVELSRARADYYGTPQAITEVTTNAHASDSVTLDFPSSFGFGASWRPRDTLTLSADYTRSNWSRARIQDYFTINATLPSDDDGVPAQPPPPVFYDELQYPTLAAVPDPDDPADPLLRVAQQDAEQIRAGVEWVLITGRVKIPLRAGYFNDRQIAPAGGSGDTVRFNGLTAGTGLILGGVQIDVAWVYEFGEYFVALETSPQEPVRYALTTNRVYASVIYRFSGRWLP
jgi:long-subunit fatty acid transport protein